MDFAQIDYEHGISAIDSGYGRPMLDAIHLVLEGQRAAIVDTAHNAAAPRVLAALAARGICADQVDWILLTHIHLDHAGGASLLARELPNARVAVHSRGARHLIDPTRLIEGTQAVYGKAQADELYGEILPIAAERIVPLADGDTLRLGAREFRVLDTPGHARHHVCYLDSRSGHLFTGDTFGVSYRELDVGDRQFVFPATSPVQFDPSALHASIDRILALQPQALYLTHFGQVRDIPRLGADLHRLVADLAQMGERLRNAGAQRNARLREGVRALLLDEARRQHWTLASESLLEIFSGDIALNADGIDAWLDAQR